MKKFYLILLMLMQFDGFSQSKDLKAIIEIVYQFDNEGNDAGAHKTLTDARKTNHFSTKELKYIDNYILYYEYFMDEKADMKKLDLALKSMLSSNQRKAFETELILNLYTAKYHHLAYGIGWQAALDVAEIGLKIPDFEQAISKTKTNYLYDLGYLYDKVGNSFEGIKYYKKSLDRYKKEFGENNTDVALNYNNLAFAYANVYNEKRTIEYYNKAAKIWEIIHKNESDKKDYLVTVYQNLTFKYLAYGDIDNARKACKKLNHYFEKKYKSVESRSQENYFDSKKSYIFSNVRMQIADNNVQKAVALVADLTNDPIFDYADKDNLRYLMGCNEAIMDFYMDHQQYKNAITLGLKSNQIASKYDYKDFVATTNAKISNAYKNLNQYQLALHYLEKAIEANNQNKIFNSSKYTLATLKANLLEKNNQQNRAADLVKNNLELLLLQHQKRKKTIEKINFNDVKNLVSTEFIKLFIESGKVYYNQFLISKNKNELDIANNLYQISTKLFKEYYLKGEYNEALNRYQSEINEGLLNIAIQKKISFTEKTDLINDIEQNASEHLIKAYRRKINLNNNNGKYLATINDLKSELYFYQNQKTENEKIKKFNAQKQIEIEKQISDYKTKISLSEKQLSQISASTFDIKSVLAELHSDQVILKYYVTPNAVFCIEITKNDIEINKFNDKKAIEDLVKSNLASNKIIQNNYKNQLSQLYKALIPELNSKKIVVVPDNFLNYVAFESLFNEKNSRFLVQDFDLSYDYSLPIGLLNKKFKPANQANNFVAFAPSYPASDIGVTRGDLKELIFAKKEAATVAKLFEGTAFLNNDATKNAFLNEKENFGIFHFSMHSLLFEDDFNKSCLVFSNNQRLYFSELYAMDFPAQMVVLSACDTGNGVLKSGEGIMSISRALTYAGVNATVMSLWQVPDKETSEIMIDFYQNLKKGETKDEALANAKRSFITKNPLKNHPFYWAGFVVNGNTNALITNYFWHYVAIGTVLFGGLFFAFRKRLF